MDDNKRKLIADALSDIVERARGANQAGPAVRIGLMAAGSELGAEEILKGGLQAQAEMPGLRVVAIGPRLSGYDALEWIETPDCEADITAALEKALNDGTVAGVVGMHYPFPIGVTTIGRVMTPGRGRPMFIASCTGASAAGRGESLLRNALYGIATAKACGIAEPTVAFLNLDGAAPALRTLNKMHDSGYKLKLGTSLRGDGGSLLRGNDLVSGAVDVLVCDTLTGNALVKIFSTFTSGGHYESQGFGYGPSVGEGWNKIVSIVSRASGAPVIANALMMTAKVAVNKLPDLVNAELRAARAAGFDAELAALKSRGASGADSSAACAGGGAPAMPPAVPVDAEIAGVDVLDMEDAAQALWKEGIYAETAMGCTGPVVRVQAAVKEKATEILKASGYL